VQEHSPATRSAKAAPRFRVLLAGHDPQLSAAATIALAAISARNGLLCDGRPSAGRSDDGQTQPTAGGATIAEVARETGLHRGALARALEELLRAGQVARAAGGFQAVPAALAARWSDHRRRIRLDERSRSLGLRAEPLLLAGLVLGQVDGSGRWVCGIARLSERTGMPRRCLFRHLTAAQAAGALHRWIAPIGRGQMILAPGLSQSGTRETAQSGTREEEALSVGRPHGDVAPVDVANRHRLMSQTGTGQCREPAPAMPQSGTRHPDPGTTGSPPEARPSAEAPAAPAGEPAAPQRREQQAPAAPARHRAAAGTHGDDPAVVVERWVGAMVRARIERLEVRRHAADVAGLLEALGPPSTPHDRVALRRDRLGFAARVIAWCPSPERLARWLVRVRRRFGVANLPAYLRRAVDRGGDPGTVLDAQNHVGRAVEGWRDFGSATEQRLEGVHAAAVEQLVAAGAETMTAVGPERDQLRADLRRYLAADRRAAARSVLLRLLGPARDDVAIARAVDGACAVAVARALLQEVA